MEREFKNLYDAIELEFSRERCYRLVYEIFCFNREVYSPGYYEAAKYCMDDLKESGLSGVEILDYPADGITKYGDYIMPSAWRIKEGELIITYPEEAKGKVLARYSENRCSVISLSPPTPKGGIEAEVVFISDGMKEKDYEGIDVKGKIIFTHQLARSIMRLAVEKGAIGIIQDARYLYLKSNKLYKIPDSVRWHFLLGWKFEKNCFAFSISPRDGEYLENLIKKYGKVKVFANVDSEIYEGVTGNVTGVIPGKGKEEILLVAHLNEPGAVDNASGCAVLLEVARCLNRLIKKGKLPPPKRSIRFLLGAEFFGISSYLANNKDKIQNTIAGLNLDCVGIDPKKKNIILKVGRTHAHQDTPSFVDDLLEWIVEKSSQEFSREDSPESEVPFRWIKGEYIEPESRILSDRSVGVPTPSLSTGIDYLTYHTSYDRPDQIDPLTLKRTGIISAIYAYFIANAGKEEARWLAEEMCSRAKVRIISEVEKYISKLDKIQDKESLLDDIERKIGYMKEREMEAVDSLLKLVPKAEHSHFKDYISFLKKEIKKVVKDEYGRINHLLETLNVKRRLKEKGFTKEDLKKDLKKLGLKEGDIVMVHSSLRSLGYVEGGANTVIDALIETVGKKGTVIVPTHTLEGRVYVGGVFDPETSPSFVGTLTEVFRKRKDAVRSRHPTHSVAAIGGKAVEITKDHKVGPALGPGSPIDKLVRWNGYILLLGVGHESNTTIHYAQQLMEPSNLEEGDVRIFDNGKVKVVHLTNWPTAGFGRLLEVMEPIWKKSGIVKEGKVGKARVKIMRARELVKSIIKELRKDPTIILCHPEGECKYCDRVRKAYAEGKLVIKDVPEK